MKFKKYLNEDTGYIDNIIKGIKKDCKPYLKELEYIREPLISGREMTSDFTRKKIRKNRKPKDIAKYMHDFLDNEFKKKFGVKLRSETLFCKTFNGSVSNYGKEFMVFPIGTYDLYYSNTIDDLYDYLDTISFKNFRMTSTIFSALENIKNLWLVRKGDSFSYRCYLNNLSREKIEKLYDIDGELIELTKEKVASLLDDEDIPNFYKKTENWKKIPRNYEIMLDCKEVYLIKGTFYDVYEGYILKELWK